MCGEHPDLPEDIEDGFLPDHGIHFCTQIQAVNRRAKDLLGLEVLGSEDYIYELDKISLAAFHRIFEEAEAHDRDYDPAFWEANYANYLY